MKPDPGDSIQRLSPNLRDFGPWPSATEIETNPTRCGQITWDLTLCVRNNFPLIWPKSGDDSAIAPNDDVYVSVYYEGNYYTEYFLQNVTTGQYSSFYNYTPYAGGNAPAASAEWITEWPGGATGLANFNNVSFSGAYGYSSSGSDTSLMSYNDTEITPMVNYGDIEAQDSSILRAFCAVVDLRELARANSRSG